MINGKAGQHDGRLIVIFVVIISIYAASYIDRKTGGDSKERVPVFQYLDFAKSQLVSVDSQVIVDASVNTDNAPETAVFFFDPLPINLASFALLQTVKGVGPKLAQEIINHRERFGPFSGPNSLQRLTGVGEKRAHYLATQFTLK